MISRKSVIFYCQALQRILCTDTIYISALRVYIFKERSLATSRHVEKQSVPFLNIGCQSLSATYTIHISETAQFGVTASQHLVSLVFFLKAEMKNRMFCKPPLEQPHLLCTWNRDQNLSCELNPVCQPYGACLNIKYIYIYTYINCSLLIF